MSASDALRAALRYQVAVIVAAAASPDADSYAVTTVLLFVHVL